MYVPPAGSDVSFLGSLATRATASPVLLTPYSDSRCQSKVKYNYLLGDKSRTKPINLGAPGTSSPDEDKITRVDQFEVQTAVSGDNSDMTYWRIKNLGTGCRVIVMNDYPDGTMGDLPGVMALNAGSNSECYPADIANKFTISLCCEKGCERYSLGQVSLLNKRDKTSNPGERVATGLDSFGKPSTSAALKDSDRGRPGGGKKASQKPGSCSDDDLECMKKMWEQCSFNAGKKFARAGKAQIVGDFTRCSQGTVGCPIMAEKGVETSTEMSTEDLTSSTTDTSESETNSSENTKSFETTTRDGRSMTMGGSVGYGPLSVSAETTNSKETENTNAGSETTAQERTVQNAFSQTVSKKTGIKEATVKMKKVSHTFTANPGSRAALIYTPIFECQKIKVTCAEPWKDQNGKEVPFEPVICEPKTVGSGEDAAGQGEYSLLYTNRSG